MQKAPVRAPEYKAILDKKSALPPDVGVLGFSHRSGDPKLKMFPISDLLCLFFHFGAKKTYMNHVSDHSANLTEAPALYYEGKVHVGGAEWYQRRNTGRKRVYVRNPPVGAKYVMPVGVIRDYREDNPGRVARYIRDPYDKVRTSVVQQLLSDENVLRGGQSVLKDINGLDVPTFYAPIVPRGCLTLRQGPALEALVLHCATTGEWGGEHLIARDNGFITRLPDGQIQLVRDAHEDEKDTQSDHFRIEGNSYIESYRSPVEQLEEQILKVFAVNVGLRLDPIAKKDQKIYVRHGQTIWLPVPKRSWTIEELRAEPTYQALLYVAALRTVTDLTDDGSEIKGLDLKYAFGTETPWVDLRETPAQRVRYRQENPMYGHGGPRMVFNPASLHSSGPEYRIDMFNLSVRVEIRRQKEERKKSKALPIANTVIEGFIKPDTLPNINGNLLKNQTVEVAEVIDGNLVPCSSEKLEVDGNVLPAVPPAIPDATSIPMPEAPLPANTPASEPTAETAVVSCASEIATPPVP